MGEKWEWEEDYERDREWEREWEWVVGGDSWRG